MALETLKGITEIDGFEIKRIEWNQPKDNFIEINDKHNSIKFRIQYGPIKEVGLNGVQIDQLISTAKIIIEGLNGKFACRENSIAITKLEEALMWLEKRKKNREKRGVEGFSKI